MTDPLSVAGSVVGVISLGIQVTQSLLNFYNAFEHQDSELVHMIDRLNSLLNIFRGLRKTVLDRHFQEDERSLIEKHNALCVKRYPGTGMWLVKSSQFARWLVEENSVMWLNGFAGSGNIREICGGFIESGPTTDHTNEIYHEEELTQTVRIAHYSVQEYLVSERIRNQKAAKFSLTSVTAHGEVAKICLIYLLEHGLSSSTLNESDSKALDESTLKAYPLARFAAFHWYHHYQRTLKHDLELEDFILKLFQSQDLYVTWLVLYEKNRPSSHTFDFRRNREAIPTPIYYASFMGLDQVLDHLVNSGQVEDATIPALQPIPSFKLSRDVNAQDGELDKALQAASYGGHKKVVQILLNKGADINAQGGFDGGKYNNALTAASFGGHEKIVQMLLDKGADVNTPGRLGSNALQVASRGGYEKVVQILLDKVAGDCGNDLAAALNGHLEEVVRPFRYGSRFPIVGPRSTSGLDQST
ncbi:ankyrin repeat-containing domain protein [Usnea florida]